MKKFFIYLKDNNIPHQFNINSGEVLINRNLFNCDFRKFIIECELNIFELDSTIVIF